MHALLLRSLAAGLTVASLLPSPSFAQRDGPFMTEFRKLMQVQAWDEAGALIKKHEDEALITIRETLLAIRDGSNEQLETEIDALGKAWKKGYDSDFVSMEYDYFALRLTGPYKKHHKEVGAHFDQKQKELQAVLAAKEADKYAGLALEFDGLGDTFAELGDHYLASECYWNCAVLSDDNLNGRKADLRKACEAWGLCVQARENAHLTDKRYLQAKERAATLTADGYAGAAPAEAPATDPSAPAGAAAGSAAATPLASVFQLAPDIEAIQRPLYTADSNFQMWSWVPLQKTGSSGQFSSLTDSPKVLRLGAAKAAVDVDGDGKGDVDIPLTGKISPVEVTLGSGAAQRHWGFLAVIGQQQDLYQGFRFNLSPDENNMSIYVAPAGSLVGTVAGTRVQVFDDNMDGLYGSDPKDWGYVGLVEGSMQHDVDSVLIGETKVARPWSKVQKIGDAWYELAPNEAGTDLVARRADVKTGTLQLELKGPPVAWLVVRGVADKTGYFFDVANGGTNKVEVPVGTYELYSGEVASGKKAQMAKALIVAGANTRTWKVGAGETVKMELGAPFTMDFAVKQDADTITVDGLSIVVVGRGNETYQRLWNCVLAPEVNLRKAGSGKGKKEGHLGTAESQEQLAQDFKNDYNAVWFPNGEPIKKPNAGEKVELQLSEKKSKLFGKLESPWKAD